MSDLWKYSPDQCDGDFCSGNCDHCRQEEDDDEVSAVRHGSDESNRQPAAAGWRGSLQAAGVLGLWIQIHNA